jgi:hypothetical protein
MRAAVFFGRLAEPELPAVFLTFSPENVDKTTFQVYSKSSISILNTHNQNHSVKR